jgi:hypothetical protein
LNEQFLYWFGRWSVSYRELECVGVFSRFAATIFCFPFCQKGEIFIELFHLNFPTYVAAAFHGVISAFENYKEIPLFILPIRLTDEATPKCKMYF